MSELSVADLCKMKGCNLLFNISIICCRDKIHETTGSKWFNWGKQNLRDCRQHVAFPEQMEKIIKEHFKYVFFARKESKRLFADAVRKNMHARVRRHSAHELFFPTELSQLSKRQMKSFQTQRKIRTRTKTVNRKFIAAFQVGQ